MKIAILAVKYRENTYEETRECLRAQSAAQVYWVDREGVGSLAEAFNRGFAEHTLEDFDYVWMITNILFRPDAVMQLAWLAAQRHWVGVSPAFQSDHAFLRPNSLAFGPGNVETPYIEFTAAMVHGPTYQRFQLDEDMPYVGHDLDWSYRVKQAGFKIGVKRDVVIGHHYLRHLDNQSALVTQERTRLRKLAELPTEQALAKKYGDNWRQKLYYKGAI